MDGANGVDWLLMSFRESTVSDEECEKEFKDLAKNMYTKVKKGYSKADAILMCNKQTVKRQQFTLDWSPWPTIPGGHGPAISVVQIYDVTDPPIEDPYEGAELVEEAWDIVGDIPVHPAFVDELITDINNVETEWRTQTCHIEGTHEHGALNPEEGMTREDVHFTCNVESQSDAEKVVEQITKIIDKFKAKAKEYVK